MRLRKADHFTRFLVQGVVLPTGSAAGRRPESGVGKAARAGRAEAGRAASRAAAAFAVLLLSDEGLGVESGDG